MTPSKYRFDLGRDEPGEFEIDLYECDSLRDLAMQFVDDGLICLRLLDHADIYQLAKNCRTSVEMIEKNYAIHLKHMIDASAINRGEQRSKRNPIETPEEDEE